MAWMRTAGRVVRANWRATSFAALVLAVGVVAGALGNGSAEPQGWRDGRSVAALNALLVDQAPGKIVVDTDGNPVLGEDGKPLRVAAAGGALVDSQGKPVRDKDGKPLKLRGNKLPKALATPQGKKRKASAKRKPQAARRKRKPPKAATPGSTAAGGGGGGEPIVVGLISMYHDRHNAQAAAYGAVQRAEDWEPIAQAVADHINRTGGAGGRKIELRMRKYDPSSTTQTYAALWEASCEFFAQGKRPVAVISPRGGHYPADCLAARRIPLLQSWPMALSRDYFDRHGGDYLFAPGGLAADRYADAYVDGLKSQGFFGRHAKVGLLTQDMVEFTEAEAALRRALQRANVNVDAEARLPNYAGAADIPNVGQAAVREALRFKVLRIDEVVNATDGIGMGFFMKGSDPNDYHPRHGISTHDAPLTILASLRGLGMERQFRGAAGIGWAPLNDVGAEQEGPVAGARAECDAIFSRSGVPLGDRSVYGQYAAHSICDSLLSIRSALAGGGSLRAGLEGLGARHHSAVAMGTLLGGSRHDGVSSYRLLRYDDGCDCLRYEGGLKPFG